MTIASGKPDSRISIERNSFDAASPSQVRVKNSYLDGSMEKQRKNSSHQEEEDSDNPETEIWYYNGELVVQNSKTWEQPLHTEPVLQLTKKVQKDTKTTWDHYLHISPSTSHYADALLSIVRKISGKQLDDPMKDLNVYLTFGVMFIIPLFEQRFISEKTST